MQGVFSDSVTINDGQEPPHHDKNIYDLSLSSREKHTPVYIFSWGVGLRFRPLCIIKIVTITFHVRLIIKCLPLGDLWIKFFNVFRRPTPNRFRFQIPLFVYVIRSYFYVICDIFCAMERIENKLNGEWCFIQIPWHHAYPQRLSYAVAVLERVGLEIGVSPV